jgi:hypothetical protein
MIMSTARDYDRRLVVSRGEGGCVVAFPRTSCARGMGSHGANRRFAGCPSCGHPLAAHMGGGCYCGCRVRATRSKPSGAPPSWTAPVPAVRRAKKASPPPPPKSPLEQLIEFAQFQMSEADATQLLIRLAEARSVRVNVPKKNPWALLREVATTHYTRDEIARYVAALRSRKAAGAALIRPAAVSRQRPR